MLLHPIFMEKTTDVLWLFAHNPTSTCIFASSSFYCSAKATIGAILSILLFLAVPVALAGHYDLLENVGDQFSKLFLSGTLLCNLYCGGFVIR